MRDITFKLMDQGRSQQEGLEMAFSLSDNPFITAKSSPSIPSISRSLAEKETSRNGNAAFSPPKTLDHQNQTKPPDSNPDPDPISAGTTAAGGSTPRSPITSIKPITTVRYGECLRNHAASIGGHVVDGCGEFMPAGEEGTSDALKCVACDCHRNFHWKEVDGETPANRYHSYNNNRSRITAPPQLQPAPPQQHHKFNTFGLPASPFGLIPPFPSMIMAFGGGDGGAPSGATESSSEDLNTFHSNAMAGTPGPPLPPSFVLSKKRFRTKFTQEQKEKMLEFAEKVGWRIHKQDEPLVQYFCNEVGVKRQVLKVWMHNNKHAMKKKEL